MSNGGYEASRVECRNPGQQSAKARSEEFARSNRCSTGLSGSKGPSSFVLVNLAMSHETRQSSSKTAFFVPLF